MNKLVLFGTKKVVNHSFFLQHRTKKLQIITFRCKKLQLVNTVNTVFTCKKGLIFYYVFPAFLLYLRTTLVLLEFND